MNRKLTTLALAIVALCCIAAGTTKYRTTIWALGLKLTGGQASSSLLRLDSGTNLATVTIGANLTWDGTTLSASGGGGGSLTTNANQFAAQTDGRITIKSGAALTNLITYFDSTNREPVWTTVLTGTGFSKIALANATNLAPYLQFRNEGTTNIMYLGGIDPTSSVPTFASIQAILPSLSADPNSAFILNFGPDEAGYWINEFGIRFFQEPAGLVFSTVATNDSGWNLYLGDPAYTTYIRGTNTYLQGTNYVSALRSSGALLTNSITYGSNWVAGRLMATNGATLGDINGGPELTNYSTTRQLGQVYSYNNINLKSNGTQSALIVDPDSAGIVFTPTVSGSSTSIRFDSEVYISSFFDLSEASRYRFHDSSKTNVVMRSFETRNMLSGGSQTNQTFYGMSLPSLTAGMVLQLNGSGNPTNSPLKLAPAFPSVSDGQVLKYDAASSTWTNGTDVGGGTGEANVNGESAVTNATRFGLVNGKSGVTNLLRSIEPIELLSGINQGTNILLRINSQTLTNLAGTGAITNAPWTNSYQPASATLTNLAGTGAITNAPWTNSYQPASSTLTNLAGTGAITNAPWTNSYQAASAILTNLSGTGAITNAPWTNSYQPATGVLTNLQNLLILSNLNNTLYAQQTALIPTNSALSNVVVNLRTNVVDLYATNNLTFTNYTGVKDGVSGSVMFRITPQLINRGVTYPAAGNSYDGTRFWTNQNSTLWTTLTQGVTYVYTLTFFGTNVHASITAWQ